MLCSVSGNSMAVKDQTLLVSNAVVDTKAPIESKPVPPEDGQSIIATSGKTAGREERLRSAKTRKKVLILAQHNTNVSLRLCVFSHYAVSLLPQYCPTTTMVLFIVGTACSAAVVPSKLKPRLRVCYATGLARQPSQRRSDCCSGEKMAKVSGCSGQFGASGWGGSDASFGCNPAPSPPSPVNVVLPEESQSEGQAVAPAMEEVVRCAFAFKNRWSELLKVAVRATSRHTLFGFVVQRFALETLNLTASVQFTPDAFVCNGAFLSGAGKQVPGGRRCLNASPFRADAHNNGADDVGHAGAFW